MGASPGMSSNSIRGIRPMVGTGLLLVWVIIPVVGPGFADKI